MEFDKVVLEGKKYQDLVKLAKERDVYRRYAPKAELIERLLDLNKEDSGNDVNNLLSDVSMPSLDVSEDESLNISQRSLRNKNDKAYKSEMASRSALKEVEVNSPAVQRRRKTVAFVTPEKHSSTKKKSPTKRIVRISTPAKPIKTPVRKSRKQSSLATSTPAITLTRAREDTSPVNEWESSFPIKHINDSSPTEKENLGTFRREGTFEITKSNSDTSGFRREGTFEIITVDKDNKKFSEILKANGEPASPLDASWNNRTRSLRGSVFTPASDSEVKTPENLSVKELCRIFEPEVETNKKETPAPMAHSRSWRASRTPLINPKSTRSSTLRASLRRSDVKPANISLPSTARKVFVTNRGKPAGFSKLPSMKNLSQCKTPKLTSPSVMKEIQLKKQVVSAKKMMNEAPKSRIPPPRKVPNFGDMHAKMYSKMESLVDAKKKVLDRAQEYESSAIPRCAVTTPNLFSAGKIQKFTKEERLADSRPVAARKLKLPEKSKIPALEKDVADSTFTVGVVPHFEFQKSTSKNIEKSPRKMMPTNRLISRLPVLQGARTTRRSENSFNLSKKNPMQIQKAKETIVTKAPVKRVGDITSKSRNVLKNVRTNKRFELQMQHRMKTLA